MYAPSRLSSAREAMRPFRKLDRDARREHRGVADPYRAPGIVCVARADVDVQVLDLDGLPILALLPGEPLRGDHAGNAPVAGEDLDALAEQDLRVPAAEPAEREVAALVGVRDREADLVQVAEEREQRPAARPSHARHRVPDGIAGHLRRTRRPPRATPRRRRLPTRSGRASRGACAEGRESPRRARLLT
jgi:hypothetical protein